MQPEKKALTQEEVHRCADQLTQEGRSPTIAAVRERLGSGSATTIHKYLTTWKDQKTPPPTASLQPMPDVLRAVQSEIDRAVSAARKSLEEEIRTLRQEGSEWTREMERMESGRENLEAQVEQLTRERNALEGRMGGRVEELMAEISLLREERDQERKDKAEAREIAAELRGRFAQLQDLSEKKESL